jgi:hypothetical protein
VVRLSRHPLVRKNLAVAGSNGPGFRRPLVGDSSVHIGTLNLSAGRHFSRVSQVARDGFTEG